MSVIVPVRDAAATLPVQLRALAAQRFVGRWEVVVADNGSVDDTVAVAAGFADRFPSLRVLDAGDRRGVNHARNAGARVARGRLLAYVDADDEVAPGWLAAIAAAGDAAEVVGGALDQDALNPSPAAAIPARLTAEGRLPTSLGFLPFAVGANLAVRADVLRRIGGWDERYRLGANDVDLSWRAQLAGHRLAFAPDAVVRYRHRADLRSIARRAVAHERANVQLYRAYRRAGARGRSAGQALRSWAWLVRHLPDLGRGEGRRAAWVREAAAAWGRVVGSLEQRVAFL